MTPTRFTCLAGALLLAAVVCAHGLSAAEEPIAAVLRAEFGLTDGDLARVTDEGRTAVTLLAQRDRRDLVVLGVVALKVPVDFFVTRFRDIVAFKQGEAVTQVGTFGTPPQLGDLQALRVDPQDLDALRACTVGECDVQLPAETIEQVRQVRWQRPYARAQAEAILRVMLLQRARSYLAGGLTRLPPYEDQVEPVSIAHELVALVDQAPFVRTQLPVLRAQVLRYPAVTLPGADDFLYWSSEQFGLKPVISLTHATIYRPPRPSPVDAVIVSKQIYASHYFNASVGFTMLAARQDAAAGCYLVYLNLSRSGTLDRHWNWLSAWMVHRELRNGTERTLQAIKRRLEADYRSR